MTRQFTKLGSDGIGDLRRMYQCFLYMRDPLNSNDPNSNHYAFPLAISPVIDVAKLRVIRIDKLPTGAGLAVKETHVPPLPPASEYAPEHQRLRSDLRPLNVVQPDGVSFKVARAGQTDQIIAWQKWTFRITFNQREGMVIHTVTLTSRPKIRMRLICDRSVMVVGAFFTDFPSRT